VTLTAAASNTTIAAAPYAIRRVVVVPLKIRMSNTAFAAAILSGIHRPPRRGP
jgi:hypothetical protein